MTTRIETTTGLVKNIALFFAAPFVALVYIVLFPFVGLGLLALMAARRVGVTRLAKRIGMMVAAPVIGFAAIVLFPFVGLAMLAAVGARALLGGGTCVPRGLVPATA